VWEAIATGPGIDSWFMGRNEVEPREGGRARMTLAGHTQESTVAAWEPSKQGWLGVGLARCSEPACAAGYMTGSLVIVDS
jgi:hypothetical protein